MTWRLSEQYRLQQLQHRVDRLRAVLDGSGPVWSGKEALRLIRSQGVRAAEPHGDESRTKSQRRNATMADEHRGTDQCHVDVPDDFRSDGARRIHSLDHGAVVD